MIQLQTVHFSATQTAAKKIMLFICFTFTLGFIYGQELGKMTFSDEGFTEKKFNHTEKKVFIQFFTVNYQTVMVSYAKAKGGMSYGSAEAGLALGLDGITNEQLQKMTDSYYEQYISQLTAAGFTIIEADEVMQNEHFVDRETSQGGIPVQDAIAPGYLTTTPSKFTQISGGGGLFNLGGLPESKKLDGVIVARVSINIPFAESQSINGGLVGGVAKVTAKADLRISPSESIPVKGDFKKPKHLLTQVSFGYKESLKWQALSLGKLKKPLEVEAVLDEDKKYKSTSVSTSGTGFSAKYSEAYAENAVLIDCDPKKYEKGINEAVMLYLNTSLESFLSNFK